MKILVTGGAGFIGSHIANRYLEAGHEVVIIDDLSSGFKKNLPPQAAFYQISITSPEIEDILKKEKPAVINHHAAQINVRTSVENPGLDAAINITGGLNLLEAGRKAGVQKVIFASTGGAIYGEQDSFPADETHRTEPLSPYGINKLAFEKYLQFYSLTYGIPFVALRYANVYGPRQNAHGEAGVIAIFLNKLLAGETPVINGDGSQTRDYVYVNDVVDCNFRALDPNVSGIFNVGTGVETDVNTLYSLITRLSGSSTPCRYGPAKKGEQLRSCIRPGKLQCPPTPLEKGLQDTVDWFKSHSH